MEVVCVESEEFCVELEEVSKTVNEAEMISMMEICDIHIDTPMKQEKLDEILSNVKVDIS